MLLNALSHFKLTCGAPFFLVSACFKSLIRSNNVSMAGSNLTHVDHGASGVA